MGVARKLRRRSQRERRGSRARAWVEDLLEEKQFLEAATLKGLGLARQHGMRGSDVLRFLGLALLAERYGKEVADPTHGLSSEQKSALIDYSGLALMAILDAAENDADPQRRDDAARTLSELGVSRQDLFPGSTDQTRATPSAHQLDSEFQRLRETAVRLLTREETMETA